MRKNILVYNYTVFSSKRLIIGMKVASGSYTFKRRLFFIHFRTKKTQENVFFDYYTFIEKLDQVGVISFKEKESSQKHPFKKYLDRENFWYGVSDK